VISKAVNAESEVVVSRSKFKRRKNHIILYYKHALLISATFDFHIYYVFFTDHLQTHFCNCIKRIILSRSFLCSIVVFADWRLFLRYSKELIFQFLFFCDDRKRNFGFSYVWISLTGAKTTLWQSWWLAYKVLVDTLWCTIFRGQPLIIANLRKLKRPSWRLIASLVRPNYERSVIDN